MVDRVPSHGVNGSASDQGVESAKKPQASLGIKQALALLHFVPKDSLRCNDSIHEVTTQCGQDSTMRIKDDLAFIVLDYAARAAMAQPSKTGPTVIQVKDNSVMVWDCCASSSVTGSLLNTRDVTEKITHIETADGMKATHTSTCMKTYFL